MKQGTRAYPERIVAARKSNVKLGRGSESYQPALASLMYLFELLRRKPRKSMKIQSVLFVLVDRQALGERIAELKIGGDLTKVDDLAMTSYAVGAVWQSSGTGG